MPIRDGDRVAQKTQFHFISAGPRQTNMDRQVLLRTLKGRTVVVRWHSGWSAGDFVKRVQTHVEHIQGSGGEQDDIDVRFADGRRVSDARVPVSGTTLYVTLPLNGGKGGFGKAIRDLGRGYVRV